MVINYAYRYWVSVNGAGMAFSTRNDGVGSQDPVNFKTRDGDNVTGTGLSLVLEWGRAGMQC